MDKDQNNNNANKNPKPGMNFSPYWIYAIIGIGILLLNFYFLSTVSSKEILWEEFEEMAKAGDVEKLVYIQNRGTAQVYLKEDSVSKYKEATKNRIGTTPHFSFTTHPPEIFPGYVDDLKDKISDDKHFKFKISKASDWASNLTWLIPFLLLIFIWIYIMRRMGSSGGGPGSQIFNIGKSKATLQNGTKVNVTFKDVAGLNEAKEEVMEVVDFLKSKDKYIALGGKIPKGVLLVGPPGTGKTLLAKAVAGEAGVPFFSISGSDFVEMFVGVGASRVRDLFKQAREKAPCIVFIDEIDAIGRARGRSNFSGNDERENTLNQLLVEMDGFGTDKGVILMAATNRADVLDTALMRPGRFDRQIGIDRPDLQGREAIFKVHLKNIKIDKDDVNPEALAEMTPGFAGADIANVCNEAALVAARRNKKKVEMDDFNYALDRVIGGLEKKSKVISPNEKKVIAYHEAGHAICGWFLEHASPLVKVTIVPRGMGTLGYAQYLPKEQYLTTVEQLEDRMCMTMGGRAAEKVFFDKISTGAQSDLDQVTKMAYAMVAVYGMNDKVGNISFYDMQNQNQFAKPYSEETAALIDEESRKMIDEQYERAQQLLRDKREEVIALAEELLEKEVLLKSDVERLIGPRPADIKAKQEEEERKKAQAMEKEMTEERKKADNAELPPDSPSDESPIKDE